MRVEDLGFRGLRFKLKVQVLKCAGFEVEDSGFWGYGSEFWFGIEGL